MKGIYDYSKTEINKMKRNELLRLKYERDKFYFETFSYYNKDWSEKNMFDEYCKLYKKYTVKELKDILKLKPVVNMWDYVYC